MANEETDRDRQDAERKPHGDKLGGATGAPGAPASDEPGTGDSPKRQGDPLADTLRSDRES